MPDPTPDSDGGILGLLGRFGANPATLYQGNLSDPATQQQIAGRGLLAMAGGFADAAMPSRMPIPFGAALGHAAAAMGPAEDAVMAARLQAAQAAQAQAQSLLTQQDVETSKAIAGGWQQRPGAGGPTTPTVPGTIGTPSVATVPHDAGPGWLPGFAIPPGASSATFDPKLGGSEYLNNLAKTAIPIALPGYTVKMTSGDRPGAEVAGGGGESQHAKDNAADFKIYGPDGKEIPNTGSDATGAYGKLALTMRMIAPQELKPWLAWGGNFSTGVTGPADLMHFDWAGDRGHRGTLAQLEQQWMAANQQPPGGGAPPATFAGTPINTPGSWYGNSPGWTDKTDRGLQANGQPVSAGPGIALPIPKDSPNFGQLYYVTAPNGKTLLLPQTDVGPGAKGRGIDINSVAAAQFGYTPGNFDTDKNFSYVLAGRPGAAPPLRYAQANTGTFSDAQPGLLNPPPGAVPPSAPAPGGPPPAGPPPAGQPPPLVTVPPGQSVPPITQPQPPAPQAGIPGVTGAPTPELIAWAQRMEALYTQMRRPVPPTISEIAKFGLIGPSEAAKLPYTYGRPGGVLQNADGTVTVMPSIQPGAPDAQGRPTQVYRGINHGVPYEVPMGPSGMGPYATAAATAAGTGAATLGPTYPTAAPGTVPPGGPSPPPGAPTVSPDKPTESPFGILPPRSEEKLPASIEEAKSQIPVNTTKITDWTNRVQPAQQAEMRMLTLASAFKAIQTGTWTSERANITAALDSIGIHLDPNTVNDPAKVQMVLHENILSTLPLLKEATARPTQTEFAVTRESREGPNIQPEANLQMLAEDIALVRQAQNLPNAYYMSGWSNPTQFESAYLARNKLAPMADAIKQEIGPLKGMPGFVPPGLPAGSKPVTVNGKPGYLLPNGQIAHPPNG